MSRKNRTPKEALIKKVVDHLKYLKREFKRSDNIKQKEIEN